MLDKTAPVKFKISNKLKQNLNVPNSKQPKIHRKINTNLWILKISRKKSVNQKSRDFYANPIWEDTPFKPPPPPPPTNQPMKHLWFVGVANICMQALLSPLTNF
jgi:hypothetical protein